MRVLVKTVAVAGLIFALTGCNGETPVPTDPAAPPAPTEDTAPTSDLIEAEAWSDMTLMANYAETKIDIYGHFETTRNACGRDAYGAFTADTWNKVATAMNEAVKLPKGEKKCIEWDNHRIDSLKIKNEAGQVVELLDGSGWSQVCTELQGEAVMRRLVQALVDAWKVADKEDCPNGFGG